MSIDWMSIGAPFWWLLIALVLLFIESMAPGLVVIFFGLSAATVALICQVFDPPLAVQLICFMGFAFVYLFALRNIFKTIFRGKSVQNGPGDEYIGSTCTVSEAIAPDAPGKVELHGVSWNAESEQTIDVGSIVRVIDRDNLTVFVELRSTQE